MKVNKVQALGYTLMELLMVIALVGILSGLIFSVYWNMLREHKSERVSVDKEREILNLQNYLRKLLGSIGFGVTAENLKIASVGCTDNNLSNFKNSNATLGLAENCNISGIPLHDRLYFRSLYATGSEKAGCWWIWWIMDPTGPKTMGVDKFGRNCIISAGDRCLFMTPNRNFLGNNFCNDTTTCSQRSNSCLIFYYNSTNDDMETPSVFRLHLDSFDANDISQRQRCAPGSSKLVLQREWNLRAYPIFDCIGGMKFQLLQRSGENLPYALRLCLLVQVSGRMNSRRNLPSTTTCTFPLGNQEWLYYRWRIIEEIIPLENLKM